MTATVIWRPEPLTARLVAATAPASREWVTRARARASSRRVAAATRVISSGEETIVMTSQLGAFFERGVGAHEIAPKAGKRVLRLSDGRFVTGPVKHPGMRPRPFLRPLLPLWAESYRRWAGRALRGF